MHRRTFLSGIFLVCLLALLAACGGGGTTSSTPSQPTTGSQQVQITITDSSIESSLKTFSVGIPYTFIVTNKGHTPHDFIIRTRVQGPAQGPQPDKGILYQSNPPVQPGATESFTYEFPLAAPQSNVQLASSISGGQSGGISIPVAVKNG